MIKFGKKYILNESLIIIIFLLIYIIPQIDSDYRRYYETIHSNSENCQAYLLNDGNILVLSPDKMKLKTKISKLTSEGITIYGNKTLNIYYSGTIGLIQINSIYDKEGEYLLFYHESYIYFGLNQNEYIIKFNDEGEILKRKIRKQL